MRSWSFLLVGAVALTAGAAAAKPTSGWSPEMTTPPGITLQYIAPARGRNGFFVQGITARGNTIGYGNAAGWTLYTYDKDTAPGKSACTAECLTRWHPAVVPAGAKASANWTVIDRQDGTKQWAFRGKPLYSCAKEADIGEAKCNGAEEGSWHTALFTPGEGMAVPPGIDVDDNPAAGGQTLVDAEGMTLYVLNGKPKRSNVCGKNSCENHFTPVAAPELALPTGEFTVAIGADGSRQWAFRGMPLYTYANDIEVGDAAGAGIDGVWTPAVVYRNFMPASTSLMRPIGHTEILATAEGMTLYKRDESYQLVTGHGLPHSAPTIPAYGRAIGIKGCVDECLKEWRPFLAPANAQPSGFWQLIARPEGTQQWTYQSYPLYTYVKDKKPGDMTGDQIYDVMVDDGDHPDVVDLVQTLAGSALYWSIIEPQ